MGLLKKIAGFLGFSKDDNHESKDEDDDNNNINSNNNNSEAQTHSNSNRSSAHFQETGLPRRGFSVPVQVSLERPHLGPLLSPCIPPDAAVQGLRWYTKALRIDEDGDVADEFLDEVLLESSTSTEDHQRSFPKFEVKYSTRPAKVKSLLLAPDGKIRQCVEHQGRLQWV
ncbi:uncharacterized protein LOC126708888 [Quercus robur]|uniref:uncharacterized protein LOC126708888 n=1 Tax=Quercus robur TaxID=38942 RepID=UPI002162D003|nr:uncharacterized protein LOC126708888 [Quercus robur]